MKQDPEKTIEKSESPVCIKHGKPIDIELELCEDCAIYLYQQVADNMGVPDFVIWRKDEDEE